MVENSIGVDIGASKMRVCLVSEESDILWSKSAPLGPSPSPQTIARLLERLIRDIRDDFSYAGVGVAGFVSTPKGEVIKMPNARINHFPAASIFARILKKRPIVVNDAVAAVYGEAVAAKSDLDLVYLTVSTGIGGAAMLNGRVVAGRDGNSHEVGHIIVDPRGRLRCGCGGSGHWEAYCSGSGIPNFAKWYVLDSEAKKSKEFKKLVESPSLKSAQIFQFARTGDPTCLDFMDELVNINAAGLASVINVYSPSLIIIGGGVAFGRWKDYILRSFDAAGRLLAGRPPKLLRAALGDLSSAYGAALLAKNPASLG